ncbi:FKBP-type peptidyl-prolyl cis-trans isomerase [Nocardioides mangrovi]|uniref:Peptidyl-prolyl cis-trans isomerase n=1 Tax=Nocardioides mangrovi TaxID=2874580 RepID=A0ABS7UFT9_9ACTN|nr:FKBP-type peptidyl-prolyl cis-trans isomerase [Nocardioides mangrovi]MBZ5739870.1 FKBP-type peptidyl-prolyl cis-trans isomerase [Nocardioides mangrovi]
MSRRLRRLPIALLPLVLASTLVACGSDDGSSSDGSSSADALHGITISGDTGKEPEVKWDGDLDTDKTETTVIDAGDGDEIKDGDQIQAYLWIGNGSTQKKAYSDYDNGQPETVTASDDLSAVFKDAVLGQTIGSRVAVTTTAADAFGDSGNTSLGIGNKDTVLIIVDLMEQYQPPTPKEVPQAQMPKIIEKGDTVTGLDFSGVDKPKADGDLLRSVVKEGNGAKVTTDSTVKVNYLGSVYGAKKPFDESYSQKPISFGLSSVVKGWTYGLDGLKVGSRVLLQIPPDLGYGSQEQSGIPANSTLYFVVDIISAK